MAVQVKRLLAVGVGAAVVSAGAYLVGTPECFTVRKIAETSSTITLGWDRQDAEGYRFYVDDVPVSRTFDPSRVSVRFGRGSSYRVEVLRVSSGISGTYFRLP